jgi:DNA-binding beta-propeller fold protein YncE
VPGTAPFSDDGAADQHRKLAVGARYVTTQGTCVGGSVSRPRPSIGAMRWQRACRLLLLITAASAAAAHAAPPDSPYQLVGTILLRGGEPSGQLAVDAATHRLFVPHSTHLTVVDLEKNRELSDVAETRAVRGVALAPALGRGFTSNSAANTITIFYLRSLKADSDHPETGANPGAIVYDPGPGRVFTMNADSNNATAITAADGSTAGTIPLGGRPGMAVTDGAGRVYVDLQDRHEIAVLDTRVLRVVRRWPVASCPGSVSLAIDVAHGRLFLGCRNGTMAALDTDSGRVVATLPIGHSVDVMRYDAASSLLFAASTDGALAVASQESPDSYRIVDAIGTRSGVRAMEIDPSTRRLYLAVREPTTTDASHRRRDAGATRSLVLLIYAR